MAGGLDRPVDFAFLPDGRILLAEHAGVVRVYDHGRLAKAPFLDIRRRVNNALDRGLIAIAADPHFARNGLVYLYYAHENDPAHPNGRKTMRLTRVRTGGDRAVPATEHVVLGGIPADCRCHVGGDIAFGRDGSIFLSTGDAASAGRANDRALRAQDLGSLAGKVLRIGANGQGLRTNPFWNGDPSANRSRVWALGLRNAFRFVLRDGVPYVGDVGWRRWEEVDVARRGRNFGWPCYEGPFRQPVYGARAPCRALFRSGRRISPPLYAYRRARGGAVTGGAFASAMSFPPSLRGAYFFGDFVRGWIQYLRITPRGVSGPKAFVRRAAGPAAIDFGPDGSLYYLAFETGELRRVRYVGR